MLVYLICKLQSNQPDLIVVIVSSDYKRRSGLGKIGFQVWHIFKVVFNRKHMQFEETCNFVGKTKQIFLFFLFSKNIKPESSLTASWVLFKKRSTKIHLLYEKKIKAKHQSTFFSFYQCLQISSSFVKK